MPTFEITAPDGRTFEVNAPEGASKEEVLSYAQKQLAGSNASSRKNVLDHLDAIDQRAPPSQPLSDYQGANYLGQQLKKGVAAGLGMPVDAATNLLNLGIAGYGVGKNLVTGSSDLPQLIANPIGGSGTFERLFLTNNAVEPTGPVNRVTGRFVRDLGAASMPLAGMAGRPTAFLPPNPSVPALMQANAQGVMPTLAAGGALSLLSSSGGELGRAVAPRGYEDIGDMSGQLFGGIAAPAALLARLQTIQQLKEAANPQNTNRLASQYVEDKIKNDVRNYPGARDRLSEALALEDQIPGFQPRIGQSSGVPSLIDMERRVATSGPEQFNKRAIQDETNHRAIQEQAEKDLPLLVKNDIAGRLGTAQTERAALAEALPEVAAEETGQTLRAARGSLKGRYDQMAAEKFGAAVQEAEKQRVRLDPQAIYDKTREIFQNPILQFDATNAPAIAKSIEKAVTRSEKPGEAPQLVSSSGEPLHQMRENRVQQIGFPELKAMREAVNQDIAREAGSQTPNARQRLRALVDIRNEIDTAADKAPDSVKKLWGDARQWYRDEYAPKFLRGINLKQSLRDVTGESRIPDEKVAGQYFKKMAPTPMNRFLTLYGDSPQAMNAMESHILDSYRREVVKDGVIDPKKHDVFLRNYGPALKQLPSISENLDSMGNAAKLLSTREAQLTQAQSLLDRAQLDKLRYEDHGTPGIDPAKVDAFLAKNGPAFKESVSSVYGEKVANEHLQNLEKIAKAATIAERGQLSGNAFPQQATNPMDLRSSLGFTSRTVFNMLRAVTTGRTSSEDMAFTLGMQSASHRIGKALIAAEERAISDPQTSRLIAESMKQSVDSEAGKVTLRKILEKGGLYVTNYATGAKNYERMTRYRAAPFAIDATQYGANELQR